MFYQNGYMLISLCQHLKVNEQRSWMKLNSVPLLLRTILCYPKIVDYQDEHNQCEEYKEKAATHLLRVSLGVHKLQLYRQILLAVNPAS